MRWHQGGHLKGWAGFQADFSVSSQAAQTKRKTKQILAHRLNGKHEPSVGVPSSPFASLASIKQPREDPGKLWKSVLTLKSEYNENISLHNCLAGPVKNQRVSSSVIYWSQVA